MGLYTHNIVTPAKAGAYHPAHPLRETVRRWIPAFAGMTNACGNI
jgi:hypothetical protein